MITSIMAKPTLRLIPSATSTVTTVTHITTVSASDVTSLSTQRAIIQSDTKIELGIGLPVALLITVVLLTAAYIIGRRSTEPEAMSWFGWCVSLIWKSKERHSSYLLPSVKRYELPADYSRQGLPTSFNVQEMGDQKNHVEMPPRSALLSSIGRIDIGYCPFRDWQVCFDLKEIQSNRNRAI